MPSIKKAPFMHGRCTDALMHLLHLLRHTPRCCCPNTEHHAFVSRPARYSRWTGHTVRGAVAAWALNMAQDQDRAQDMDRGPEGTDVLQADFLHRLQALCMCVWMDVQLLLFCYRFFCSFQGPDGCMMHDG